MKPFQDRSVRRGVALLVVLAFLTLITVLVLSFFSSVATERTVSQSYASGTEVKLLSEAAIQIVTGQIREATCPAPPLIPTIKTTSLAWASQPGMIRVFGSPTAAGSQPFAYYKLYSSDTMVVTNNFASFDPGAEATGYATTPELYADLNRPVLVADDNGPITVASKKYRADYPIIDPSALGMVEGFYLGPNDNDRNLVKPPGYAGNWPPRVDDNPTLRNMNPAPMPVKWLYVLRDGTTLAPTSASNGTSFFTGNKITKENPIVGRIAFWTDDESSKVNINTASEGMYWDTPFTASKADAVDKYTSLGKYQPSTGEYARYPGHPATTSLSPVLGKLLGWNRPAPSSAPINYGNPGYLAFKDLIQTLSPRVSRGGSYHGQVDVFAAVPIPPKFDRLYPTVEEMLFRPNLKPAGPDGFQTRDFNWLSSPLPSALNPADPNATFPSGDPMKSRTVLQAAKFFLTPNSRSPDLNLYGRPRISMWPVSAAESERSAKDNVFAFVSTAGSKSLATGVGHYPFYFTRSDSRSPVNDYNDVTRGGRNKVLYTYLHDLFDKPIPGFGGTFAQKFGADRDQIITEMYDYIRCTNLYDTSNTGGSSFTTVYKDNTSDFAGQVTPIEIGDTRGFGRFPTISEAVLLFYRDPNFNRNSDKEERQMRALMFFEVFSPSFGYMGMKDTYSMRVDATKLMIENPLSTAAQPKPDVQLFSQVATNAIATGVAEDSGNAGRSFGGYMGIRNQLYYPRDTVKSFDRTNTIGARENYPFISDFIRIPSKQSGQQTREIKLRGGEVKIELFAGAPPIGPAVQTVTVNFPEASMILPSGESEFTTRTGLGGIGQWINTGDAVRSVEAKTDLRLIAAQKTVPSSYFGPTGDPSKGRWQNPSGTTNSLTNNIIHGLRTSIGPRSRNAVPTGTLVKLDASLKYPAYRWDGNSMNRPGTTPFYFGDDPSKPSPDQGRMADLPEEVDGVARSRAGGQPGSPLTEPGDWDSGFSKWYDGPFINKPDEGKTAPLPGQVPYFQGNDNDYSGVGGKFFTPNRLVGSPGWFGSLPTGVKRNYPYETLLFRPDYTGHRGLASGSGSSYVPPDHLIMDLFSMPVVEPYPISEPFSTAGRINMNYQIVPFGNYMKRDTGMRAVLRGEKMLAISKEAYWAGKPEVDFVPVVDGNRGTKQTDYGHQIDEDVTLAFLEKRWRNAPPEKQIFRSASEICELDLYPKKNDLDPLESPVTTVDQARNTSEATAASLWKDFWLNKAPLTGDNVRERPYARLYARLTTKSNTFKVHLLVQSLQRPASDTNYNTWNESTGRITGEYRGSAVIERYLDAADRRFNPSEPGLTFDQRFNPDRDSLETAYRFRILSTKQFVP